jgi:hypothetical protein
MPFLSRLIGAAPKASRAWNEGRSPRRGRAQFNLETLEDRDLKSEIPGVSFQYGAINITATQPGHNTAIVEQSGDNVRVTFNGNSVEYNPNEVGPIYSVIYSGDQTSQGGSDTFINNTGYNSSVAMYGGNNVAIGGYAWDMIMVTQDNNYVDARGGGGYVYSFAGPSNSIASYGDVWVFDYAYDPYARWW